MTFYILWEGRGSNPCVKIYVVTGSLEWENVQTSMQWNLYLTKLSFGVWKRKCYPKKAKANWDKWTMNGMLATTFLVSNWYFLFFGLERINVFRRRVFRRRFNQIGTAGKKFVGSKKYPPFSSQFYKVIGFRKVGVTDLKVLEIVVNASYKLASLIANSKIWNYHWPTHSLTDRGRCYSKYIFASMFSPMVGCWKIGEAYFCRWSKEVKSVLPFGRLPTPSEQASSLRRSTEGCQSHRWWPFLRQ